jgi:hypothetical protein
MTAYAHCHCVMLAAGQCQLLSGPRGTAALPLSSDDATHSVRDAILQPPKPAVVSPRHGLQLSPTARVGYEAELGP